MKQIEAAIESTNEDNFGKYTIFEEDGTPATR